ncbi:MAG: NUDIX hydrolase [Deltaproteobacteria bacterium]|nr:NUDIX hydrolase [Deltaproteobacteria bacterium]
MSDAIVHSRTHLGRTRVLDIGTEDVTLPSGVRATLDVLKHPGAACVLPMDGDRVTLIRQYRHCAGGFLWEAPAGTLRAGEHPDDCARRELVEEAGLVAGRLTGVGHVFTAPGFTDEKIHLYLAYDCAPAPVARDEDELITDVRWFAWSEVDALVARGELCDAKTLSVLLHARRVR